jgi:signal peptidase II
MRSHRALFASVLILLASTAFLAGAEKTAPIEQLTAFAANMQSGQAGVIEIAIERWSTEAERDMLLEALQEGGEDALLKALEKIRPPVGYMRTPNSIGWDLYFARQIRQPDGGRKIILATNRRVNIREAGNNTRSMQYQFTLIEIHLDKNGKGEGKMVPAAKVSWDAKQKRIEVENYSALPVDLVNVKSTKSTKKS